ncbi:MAG: hypothetical protein NZM27_10445 [Acetobacteraceae bacterium]|nr:hypothetical protein [Acetobacteraceae bacterium]MCX7686031.1 hypothetical protein [Acetobacteraceae bacterium]MDW8397583.1 hypothetical protein [Acetobacteraceae bacterium]
MTEAAATAMRGVWNDPVWLSGLAGGAAAAALVAWATAGLPLAPVAFWLVPLPLLMAGLGFGLPAAAIGAAGGALLLLLASSLTALALFGFVFAVPVLAALATGASGSAFSLARPFALLGLWPAALVLVAAVLLADHPGGFEGALREAVTGALRQMGAPADPATVDLIVQVKAGALAFWFAVSLAASAAIAQRFLSVRGLARLPSPRWASARLPGWYPPIAALAIAAWLLGGENAILASVALALGVPLLLQGLAAIHDRSRAFAGRRFLLAGVYAVLILFSIPAAVLLAGFGVFDQYGRRAAPPGQT